MLLAKLNRWIGLAVIRNQCITIHRVQNRSGLFLRLFLSAEQSRGSTCKWFRLVVVFSREKKKQEMKKMKRNENKKGKMKINGNQ